MAKKKITLETLSAQMAKGFAKQGKEINDLTETVGFVVKNMATKDDIAAIRRDMATKDQVIALHTQVNSIERQLRDMKHTKLHSRVATSKKKFSAGPAPSTRSRLCAAALHSAPKPDHIEKRFGPKFIATDWQPTYNAAPSQLLPVILGRNPLENSEHEIVQVVFSRRHKRTTHDLRLPWLSQQPNVAIDQARDHQASRGHLK